MSAAGKYERRGGRVLPEPGGHGEIAIRVELRRGRAPSKGPKAGSAGLRAQIPGSAAPSPAFAQRPLHGWPHVAT